MVLYVDFDDKRHFQFALSKLSAALSASLRIELLCQIERLFSGEDAALWAQRTLVAKNRLSAADGQQVEEAFAVRLAVISAQNQESGETVASDQSLTEKTRTLQIDKGGVLFPEARRALRAIEWLYSSIQAGDPDYQVGMVGRAPVTGTPMALATMALAMMTLVTMTLLSAVV